MRAEHFAPLPLPVAADLYDGLASEDDWRLTLAYVADAKRAGALSILALVRELEAMPARVSEPMMGRIRCQWWRDALGEAFGPAPVRAHPLCQAIERSLGGDQRMLEPLVALVDGADDVLDLGGTPKAAHLNVAAAGVWGRGAAALAIWLDAPGHADAASTAATSHAILRLGAANTPPLQTRSLPRLSTLLAQTARTDAEKVTLAAQGRSAASKLPPHALPSVLPATLLSAYARGKAPGALAKRARYFRAVLRGRA